MLRTIYGLIEDKSTPTRLQSCFKIVPLEFNAKQPPKIDNNITKCIEIDTTFNLIKNENLILNGQNSSLPNITYFDTSNNETLDPKN